MTNTIRVAFFAMFIVTVLAPAELGASKVQPKTLQSWETYAQLTEQRIAEELNSNSGSLVADFRGSAQATKTRNLLERGQVYIEKMTTNGANGKSIDVPVGLIHHWYGSIFIPNISLPALMQWVQNYDRHSQYFKEVERSKLVSRNGDTFQIFLRLEWKTVVTVHYNTDHTVVYRTHAPDRISSRSFTTKIAEIQKAGSPSEKEKPVGDDSGFFWRLNSYWRFQAQDGGVVVACESISLSRSIPFGLGWMIKGFLASVPRASLAGTLIAIRDGIAQTPKAQ